MLVLVLVVVVVVMVVVVSVLLLLLLLLLLVVVVVVVMILVLVLMVAVVVVVHVGSRTATGQQSETRGASSDERVGFSKQRGDKEQIVIYRTSTKTFNIRKRHATTMRASFQPRIKCSPCFRLHHRKNMNQAERIGWEPGN